MNKSHSLVILFILIISPMFPVLFVPTTTTNSVASSDEISAGLDASIPDTLPKDDVELSMMFFTETPSSEDGLYYVCRSGTDAIAYFGESIVKYLSGNTVFTLEFPGSNMVTPEIENPIGSVTNYLLGNDQSEWKTGIEDCSVLRFSDIYPGIDLVYKIQDGNLKYEFVVAPNANPELIQLRYSDADKLDVHADHIAVSKSGFSFSDTGLMTYQGDTEVKCEFQSLDMNTIRFHIGYYEETQTLVIDPFLVYSTYLGGSGEERGGGIAVENGNIYVTGSTDSINFPTLNAMNDTNNGNFDLFVTKLSADGQTIIYSTYFGGSSDDYGEDIAVSGGYVYITGSTSSSDFPTYNAYISTFGGTNDCFMVKLAIDGQSLVYGTFLGGTGTTEGHSVAVESDYAYITGSTTANDFPTVNAYDSSYNGGTDAFMTQFAVDGQSLVCSTFLGGSNSDSGEGIAVEYGYIYVTGSTSSSDFPTAGSYSAYDSTYNSAGDAFVTKFVFVGNAIMYSTFLGGNSIDDGYGIAAEDGSAYINGSTYSQDFPTSNSYDSAKDGQSDVFIAKFSSIGELAYSTFLGGVAWDVGEDIAVEDGFAYITGCSYSPRFPTYDAFDSTLNGSSDCIVVKLAVDGQSLVYSSYLGGIDYDKGFGIAVDSGSVFIIGNSKSSDFPTISALNSTYGGNQDCFISIISVDSDMDSLSDWHEGLYGTNSFCIDTDNDNFLDAYEIAYGSNATDPLDYPGMPQSWYDAIYEDLDGNATLIQQIKDWLDGNYTAIQTLFTYVEGNATLLLDTVALVGDNTDELAIVAALATANYDWLDELNTTAIENITLIQEVIDMLGVSVGDGDYDGLDDLTELSLGTDLQCVDTDNDNLLDNFEVKLGTDPLDDDSDGDSYLDGLEVIAGTNPLDALDYPGAPAEVDNTILYVVIGGAGVAVVVILGVFFKKRRAS